MTSSSTSAKPSKSGAETCQCATFFNVAIPEHRPHPCDREIEKKHVLCRPCALNWHDGPCDTYYREPVHHITKTCARCGHDSALHPPRSENDPVHTWEELPDRFSHLLGGIRAPQPKEIDVGEWSKVTPKDFRDTGLLYAVNELVLWPLGYAIGVEPQSEDPDAPLHLMRLEAGEVIVEGEFDVTKEPRKTHPMLRFVEFAKERIETMPEEDQKLARAQFNKILGPDVV